MGKLEGDWEPGFLTSVGVWCVYKGVVNVEYMNCGLGWTFEPIAICSTQMRS